MSSKIKNSASGPKYAVSPIPVNFKYSSAFWAMYLGSLEYFSLVMGSTIFPISARVGTSKKRIYHSCIWIWDNQHVTFIY